MLIAVLDEIFSLVNPKLPGNPHSLKSGSSPLFMHCVIFPKALFRVFATLSKIKLSQIFPNHNF